MKIALIAGETSGDQLGGWLMAALKKRQPDLQFIGLGGTRMQAEGLRSLFPMDEITLIGLLEVLPHYLGIKRRIRAMVEYIEAEKPDILITIDSRGFTYRVVAELRARGIHRPVFYHYVAPSVWGYRPKRVATAAALFDALFCLLPFEPPYFEDSKLPAYYVGHEIAWYWREKGDGAAFRARHGLASDAPLLALFPGSRRGELKRMLPIFRDTVAKLKALIPALQLVIMIPEHLKAAIGREMAHWPEGTHIISNAAEKRDLFAAATAGLAKSGTIALECALAGLPSVTTYRIHSLSAAILRRMIRTPYFNLANILAGRIIIPELMQENATPEKLSMALKPLILGGNVRDDQLASLRDIARLLGAAEPMSPSDKIAAHMLS